MADVAAGVTIILVTFAAIGFGPALWLLGPRFRNLTAVAVAPAAGLAIVTIVGTLVTRADLPVSRWTAPLTAVLIAASVALAIWHRRRTPRHSDERAVNHAAGIGACAFAVTTVVMLAPQLLGGLSYVVLRGNGTDSFNYISAAGYLDHEPLSFAASADAQRLVNRHQSYVRAKKLLATRWSTMMVLAYSARVAGVEPYRFELALSVAFVLVGFGVIYVWCLQLFGLPPGMAAGVAAAVTSGFWAQFVVDIRADAQQHTLPLLMLSGFLAARAAADERDPGWREHAFLGLTISAIVYAYPELIPTAVLALGLFAAATTWRAGWTKARMVGWAISAATVLVIVEPVRQQTWAFLTMQLRFASAARQQWHLGYFEWLYDHPAPALWGLAPFTAVAWLAPVAWGLGALLTALLLLAVAELFRVRQPWRPGLGVASTMVVAVSLQAVVMYQGGNYWAAGKAVSYGFAFAMLAVAGYGLRRQPTGAGEWQRVWRRVATASVCGLIVAQLALALHRPLLAANNEEAQPYIVHHPEYRRHDWNLAAIMAQLPTAPKPTVWANLRNPWLSDYIGFAAGWRADLVNVGMTRDRVDLGTPQQDASRPPDFLIIEGDPQASSRNAPDALARVGGLILVRWDGAVRLAGIDNPNGVDGAAETPALWLGDRPVWLRVLAGSAGCASLNATLALGPGRSDLPIRHLNVTSADGTTQALVVGAGPASIELRTVAGANAYRLQLEETAKTSLPSDPRPLLLHASTISVLQSPCRVPR